MRKLRKFVSIFIGKLALFMLKILKRGSSFPGTIAFKLNKNILKDFNLPDKVICVTGSSGKGSTSKIIAETYRDLGFTVAYNDKGSNERSAVITTLLENCNFKGTVNKDMCVFEVDERYAKYIFPYINPNYVVITNITRDQPPRQRHFDFIYEELRKSLNPTINLVMNSDDPYLQKFNLEKEFNITYYGINKLKYSYEENKFNSLNIYRCPKCNAILNYSYYHVEHLGDYSCSKCDFKKPKNLYTITDCDYIKENITINNEFKIDIKNDLLFNLYNTVAAFTVLALLKEKEKDIAKSISKMNNNIKLYDNYEFNNKKVYVLNNKAENATTYNQSILFTTRKDDLKTVVIGWKEISRRYNFDDLSWLYDIDFELLKNNKVDKFICTGPQKYDIATRLKYAGIEEDKIVTYYDLYDAKQEIRNCKGNIYAILNFDYIEPFNEILEED